MPHRCVFTAVPLTQAKLNDCRESEQMRAMQRVDYIMTWAAISSAMRRGVKKKREKKNTHAAEARNTSQKCVRHEAFHHKGAIEVQEK